jgi:PAS domain S-box-containing protein
MLIRTRLLLAALLPAVFAALIGAVHWAAEIKIENARRNVETAKAIRIANFELSILAQEYLLFGNARIETQLRRRHQSLGELLAEPALDQADDTEERELALALRRGHQELGAFHALLLASQPERREPIAAALLVTTQHVRSQVDHLATIQQRQLEAVQRRSDILVMTVLVVLAIASAVLLALLSNRLMRGIQALREGANRIAMGDLNHRIPADTADEIQALAKNFNTMADALRGSYASIDELNREILERKRAEARLDESQRQQAAQHAASLEAQNQARRAALNLMEDAVAARNRAEVSLAALRASEERFQLAMNASQDGLWEWNIQTDEEYFSPRWCEIAGYSGEEQASLAPTYKSWEERIHPEDRERVKKSLADHLDKGTPYDVEYRHRHSSGEYRWQRSRGIAVRDDSGKPRRMVGTISDITDRREAEAALIRSRAMLAQAEELGRAGGWEFNIDTQRQTWTQMVYDIHELDAGMVPTVSQGIDFYTAASRPIITQAVQRAIEHGETFDLELEIITARGNLRSVHAIGRADLAHRKVYGFFQDITGRKRAEAALAEQIDELKRWQQISLGREARILTVKQEVNVLLAEQGRPPRYPSTADAETE